MGTGAAGAVAIEAVGPAAALGDQALGDQALGATGVIGRQIAAALTNEVTWAADAGRVTAIASTAGTSLPRR